VLSPTTYLARFRAHNIRVRIWVADHAPLPLLTHAHEVFIAVAMVIIGGGLVFGDVRPGSVHSTVPEWLADAWAWSMLGGGILTLVGMFGVRPKGKPQPRLEWAGQLLLGYGCAFYTVALLHADFNQTAVAGLVFGGLSLVSFWRSWKITSEPFIRHRTAREAAKALLIETTR
jgi:hypothetical protein